MIYFQFMCVPQSISEAGRHLSNELPGVSFCKELLQCTRGRKGEYISFMELQRLLRDILSLILMFLQFQIQQT